MNGTIKSLLFFILSLGLLSPPASAYSLMSHLGQGTKGAFTDSNKWIWLSGLTLSLVAANYDLDIYEHYGRQEKEEFPDSVGDVMGTGIPGAGIALLTMGLGWISGSRKVLGAGASHAEALFATFIYTSSLKIVMERDRPQEFNPTEQDENIFNASFPSGHTSTAFATAGSIMASTGPILGIPVLILAGITGYSRVQQRAHYAADVIFGATLGYTMGTGFYKHHQGGRSIGTFIFPYFEDRDHWGLVAKKEF